MKRPIRLAVVDSHPIQYHAPLYRELAARHELTVFFAYRATPADQAAAGYLVPFDWDVDLLSGYRSEFLDNVARPPGLDRFGGCDTPSVGGKLRQGRFDAVLVMGWRFKAFVQAIRAAKIARLPVLGRSDSTLATPRGALKRLAKEAAYPILLRAFNATLPVGVRSRAYFEHYRYPTRRLFLAPHGVDANRFAAGATDVARAELRTRHGVAPTAPVALFAGRLVPFKRPLDLIAAAALARAKGLALEVIIAGDGPLRTDIAAAAAEAGVPLHLLGFCNQASMPGVYAAADLLVLPSDGNETWGLVANEALASGRPLVLSDAVGAAADLGEAQDVCRVFPVGDVGELARAIEGTIASPPQAASIASLSRRYGIATAADGIDAALRTILGRGAWET